MIDSCSPRKLEPGFAQTYSKPSDLNTSTMKSDPLRWLSPRTWTSPGGLASAAAVMIGVVGAAVACAGAGWVDCASTVEPTIAAALASAPVFRKLRRCTD